MNEHILDTRYFDMDLIETPNKRTGEEVLALYVLQQADDDIQYFYRKQFRMRIKGFNDPKHLVLMHGILNQQYKEDARAALDALSFLLCESRSEDREKWCDMAGINPDTLTRFFRNKYKNEYEAFFC